MFKSSLPYKAAGIWSTIFPNSSTTLAAVTVVPAICCAAGKAASAANKVEIHYYFACKGSGRISLCGEAEWLPGGQAQHVLRCCTNMADNGILVPVMPSCSCQNIITGFANMVRGEARISLHDELETSMCCCIRQYQTYHQHRILH